VRLCLSKVELVVPSSCSASRQSRVRHGVLNEMVFTCGCSIAKKPHSNTTCRESLQRTCSNLHFSVIRTCYNQHSSMSGVSRDDPCREWGQLHAKEAVLYGRKDMEPVRRRVQELNTATKMSDKKRKRREDGSERPQKKATIPQATVQVELLENDQTLGPLLGMRLLEEDIEVED